MSHQGTNGLTCSTPHHQALKRSLDWLLASATGATYEQCKTYANTGNPY
jgi:hypothetical protein